MHYTLLIFALTLVFITVISLRFRLPSFFTLIAGALLYGLASGMTLDAVFIAIIGGLGRVFGIFAIIIICGAIIASTLQEQGLIRVMIADLRRRTENPYSLSGIAGYIFALPTTCCITAFVMLTPILESLGPEGRESKNFLYLAAVGSVISYTLLFPTPVMIPIFTAFGNGLSPLVFDLVVIPVSLIILAGIVLVFRAKVCILSPNGQPEEKKPEKDKETVSAADHWRAWGPFLAILAAIPAGSLLLGLPHEALIQFIMLAGAFFAVAVSKPDARLAGIRHGTRHAGIIMFDICGAGALGTVIVQGGFAESVLPQAIAVLPLIMVPFLITALIQAAQGSRVVSAVIASQILAGTPASAGLHPLPLILSVAAGTCVVSYVTDPYFWLLQRTTGDTIRDVVYRYTLPLVVAGLAAFFVAIVFQLLIAG